MMIILNLIYLYGNTLQFTEFININNGGTISNYLDYDDESISESNFEHNIIPNDTSFNYNGRENSDILLRYKSSPNNTLNIHHLDLTKEMDLRYNNPLTPILIYFKVPKEEYDINNLTIESDEELYYTSGTTSEDGLYKIINGKSIQNTNINLNGNISIPEFSEIKESEYYYIYIDISGIPKEFKDIITEGIKTVKFKSESVFTGYVFIWPENCKLTTENSSAIIDRKYIQIPVNEINSAEEKMLIYQ